jgi:hypothetical protein
LMLDSYESQKYSFLSCCDNSPHVNLPNGILNNDNRQNDHAPNNKPQNGSTKLHNQMTNHKMKIQNCTTK